MDWAAPRSLRRRSFRRACLPCFLLILPQYEAGSAPALALKATQEKTKTRFANYADQGLLCGKDGLPHLIVDGNLQHLGEFTVRLGMRTTVLVTICARSYI